MKIYLGVLTSGLFGVLVGLGLSAMLDAKHTQDMLREITDMQMQQQERIEKVQEKVDCMNDRLKDMPPPSRGTDRGRIINTTRTVSAYCLDSNTAMGKRPTVGKTIATSSKYPFGTKVIIDGHEWTVEDRGGPLIEGDTRMDIYLGTRQECLEWGIPKKKVTIILPKGE